jgi:hypothetical protein
LSFFLGGDASGDRDGTVLRVYGGLPANEMGASAVPLTPFDCTELLVKLYRTLEDSRLPVFHNIGVA